MIELQRLQTAAAQAHDRRISLIQAPPSTVLESVRRYPVSPLLAICPKCSAFPVDTDLSATGHRASRRNLLPFDHAARHRSGESTINRQFRPPYLRRYGLRNRSEHTMRVSLGAMMVTDGGGAGPLPKGTASAAARFPRAKTQRRDQAGKCEMM